MTITRTGKVCSLTITDLGSVVPGKISPSTGKLTISNNKAIFTVSSSTTTMELSNGSGKPVYSGN